MLPLPRDDAAFDPQGDENNARSSVILGRCVPVPGHYSGFLAESSVILSLPFRRWRRAAAPTLEPSTGARLCSICTHPNRAALDPALLCEVSEHALRRHRDSHLAPELLRARDEREELRAADLLRQLRALLALDA